jgi:hypothetical protein
MLIGDKELDYPLHGWFERSESSRKKVTPRCLSFLPPPLKAATTITIKKNRTSMMMKKKTAAREEG